MNRTCRRRSRSFPMQTSTSSRAGSIWGLRTTNRSSTALRAPKPHPKPASRSRRPEITGRSALLEPVSPPPVSARNASWVAHADRSVHPGKLESQRADTEPDGRARDAHPPALLRPDRAAARRLRKSTRSWPTQRPDAYGRLVDRLLASPHYGERWARHWMDIARFAESHGYEQDYDRPFAFHYRDFLIKALNRDMPYRPVRALAARRRRAGSERPAGDGRHWIPGRGAFPTQLTEAEFESARYNELDDMVSTTGTAMLGLTIGCARCHDHKFDPISSDEYYRIASVFTTAIRSEVDLVMKPGGKPTKVQVTSEGLPHTKHHADERGFPHFYPKTYVLARGDVNQKQAEAEPGYLHVLERGGRSDKDWRVAAPTGWTRTSMRRTALANWITDISGGAGPLAARVIVNRLWQHHLGPRHRRHAQRFRRARRAPLAPGTARMAGRSARQGRLESQALAQADRDERRLHAGQSI